MVELVEKQSDNAADVESPSKADEQKVEEVAADASNENVDASEAKIDETVGEKVDEPIDENIEKSDDKEESKDENAGGESKAEGETAEADKPDEKEGEQDEKKAEKDEKGDELDEKMDDIELSEQPESFSPEHPDDSTNFYYSIQNLLSRSEILVQIATKCIDFIKILNFIKFDQQAASMRSTSQMTRSTTTKTTPIPFSFTENVSFCFFFPFS